MIVDDRRPVGDWSAIGCQNSWSVRGFRCSIENLSPTKLLERLQSTGRGAEDRHWHHTPTQWIDYAGNAARLDRDIDRFDDNWGESETRGGIKGRSRPWVERSQRARSQFGGCA